MSQERSFDLTQARDAVRRMVEILGWDKYHTFSNLALSISLEASELLQVLQWRTEEEVNQLFADIDSHSEVSDEIADVTINLLSLCDRLSLDLNLVTVEKCQLITKRFENREGAPWGANRTGLRCQDCGEAVESVWSFCSDCGSRLIEQEERNE